MSFLLAAVPWYIRISAIALALVAAIAFGFTKGLRYKQAQWDEFNREVAAERVKEVARLAASAREVQEQVSTERQKRADDARKFRERLRNASHLVACDPAAAVRLTAEFVGLYNEGLYQGLPGPANTPGANGTGVAADSVDAEAVLENHAANAEVCNMLRAQISGWQFLARKNGWVK